jgi:hypothetical protein
LNSKTKSDAPKVTRNRTIVNARRAIAEFVESNAPRFNSWLERVADGIPKRDQDGRPIRDGQGSIVYVVKPDPAQAIKLVGELTEYHLPKLSRSEQSVAMQIEQHGEFDPSRLSTEELQRRLLVALGMGADVIEVVPVEATQTRVEALSPLGMTTDPSDKP